MILGAPIMILGVPIMILGVPIMIVAMGPKTHHRSNSTAATCNASARSLWLSAPSRCVLCLSGGLIWGFSADSGGCLL